MLTMHAKTKLNANVESDFGSCWQLYKNNYNERFLWPDATNANPVRYAVLPRILHVDARFTISHT